MKSEYANVHDLFAIPTTASLQETLIAYDVMSHVQGRSPDSVNAFQTGGLLEGRVKNVRYRRFAIPKGGLKIPITIVVKKSLSGSVQEK